VHLFERAVRFEDVDAAGIVFFARFFNYAHEAMESLLAGLDGGYVRLINERRIGMPAVHADADFQSPARFGDVLRIEVTVPHVGNKSCAYRYAMSQRSGAIVAIVTHTCVVSDLVRLKGIPIPDDVRALLSAHRL
jgi:4-hydroxybenzoyl-CoA thioesterase